MYMMTTRGIHINARSLDGLHSADLLFSACFENCNHTIFLTLVHDAQDLFSDLLVFFCSPHASRTVTIQSFSPLSMMPKISSVTFLSSSVGSPTFTKVGKFKSSFVSPLSVKRLTLPLSASAVNTWYSTLLTKGTDTLWEVGQRSSYFFAVKMSKATMCAFACPCLPVFDVVTSATLHGCPLIMTWLPLRNSPACCG